MTLGVGTTAFGQAAIPPESLNRLRRMVAVELEGHASALVEDATVKHILAYEGSAFTPDVEFVYQLFPTLGMFRILPTRKEAPNWWLYMSCGKVDLGEAVKIKEDGTCSLNEGLRNRVLACASGILYRDITMAELSCRQLPNHYLYSQKVRAFVSGVSAVRILVDPQHKAIAINSSNYWSEAKQVKGSGREHR